MPRILPNWLEAYLAYTYSSESPEVFHFWVGVSIITGALRRNVWFDHSYFKVWPNQYITLVSPPGKCKKSTSMRIGKSFLEKVPTVKWGVDSTSRERLINDLATSFVDNQSSMTAHSSELGSMFTTSGMDMVLFLTDIYDSPDEWVHRTKTSGTSKIRYPCLNLLAATTDAWMSTAMPLSTVGIGLTSRTIYVFSDQPRVRPPIPKLSKEQQQLRELLDADLQNISTIEGEYTFSPDAWEYYDHWYEYVRPHDNVNAYPHLAGFYERKHIHAIKLSMALSAAVSSELIITKDTIATAIDKLTALERPMGQVFSAVGRNPLAADYYTVLAFIAADNRKMSELMDKFKHNLRKDELEEIIQGLLTIGAITLLPGGIYATVKE